MSTVLIILLVLILLGGVGWGGYGYTQGNTYAAPAGLLVTVILIILIVWLVRGGLP